MYFLIHYLPFKNLAVYYSLYITCALYNALMKFIDCSQPPIFPCDRRDRARLTVDGGHFDFQMNRGGGARGS